MALQDLPPFLDTKEEFHIKDKEKMSNIINPIEFQLSRVPGCTLLDGNKKKRFKFLFWSMSALGVEGVKWK